MASTAMPTHEQSVPSDDSRTHRSHHEYSYRLPSPPRIVVPPPTLSADAPKLELTCHRIAREQNELSFLEYINMDDIIPKNTLMEWAYERRRAAQMILPWIYLGPSTAAKDGSFLQREGITMAVGIHKDRRFLNAALRAASAICSEVAAYEAADYHTLIGRFSEITRAINRHIASVWESSKRAGVPRLGKALVFCDTGNEMSAAVVAAYMMETLDDIDHVKTLRICQAQRFCISFQEKHILQTYWEILLARRAVGVTNGPQPQAQGLDHMTDVQSSPPHVLGCVSRPKRGIDETRDDEDIEMADDLDPSDLLRFENRDMTPFG